MTNVLVAVVAIAMILGAALTITGATLSSAGTLTLAWDEMVDRKGNIQRTQFELIETDLMPTSTDIEISMRNTGQTSLAAFDEWDVMLRYYATSANVDLNIEWLTYVESSTPSDAQWTVEGLYTNAENRTAEIFEPNVFNPGEEMILKANITPVIPTITDNVLTVGAANGVTITAPFSR